MCAPVFPDRDHFAAYNGTAPIEVSSGGRKVYRLSRRGNPHLIIPLLDVLRDALRDKAKAGTAPWARDAAVTVGRAAVAVKYGAAAEVSGAQYIKKIFQVPFTLPRTGIGQLPSYLDLIEATAGFAEAQLADFRDHVRPHFRYLADEGALNPREIKLLINTYVLQLKVLWPRLGDDLDPDVVLALLCMNFRLDWRSYHDQLTAEPQLVQPVLRDAVRSPGAGGEVWLPGAAQPVPPILLRYLGDAAWPLLRVTDQRPYLTVAESTWSADPWIPQARAMALRLRRSTDEVTSGVAREGLKLLLRDAQDLRDFIARRKERSGSLRGIRLDLEETATQIVASVMESASSPDAEAELLRTRLTAMFDRLDAGLRDYQRYANAD